MSPTFVELQYVLAIVGTVAFAVTAVDAVTPRGIDLWGACVMGLITAIGGGTIRDLILDIPPFWAEDLLFIWVALIASLATFFANRFITRRTIFEIMLYIDALGVATFAIQAAGKVYRLDFAMPLGPIMLGVMTAIGGGLLRDVLAGVPTLLMRQELYAIPVTVGCVLYVWMRTSLPEYELLAAIGCTSLIFVLRAAAIYWNVMVPGWLVTRAKVT